MKEILDDRLKPKDTVLPSTISLRENLAIIETLGWATFRGKVTQMNYALFIEDILKKFPEGTEIPQTPGTRKAPEYIMRNRIEQARVRATFTRSHLQQVIPKDVATVFQDRNKKVVCRGRNVQHNPSKLTRIYVGVPNYQAPELFNDFVTTCYENEVLEDIDIVLNLENFSYEDMCSTNTILLYCPGEHPPIDKIARTIQRVKNTSKNWQVSESQHMTFQRAFVSELMLPIDPLVGLVETTGMDSYHSSECGFIRYEIGRKFNNLTLEDLRNNLTYFSAEKPGIFEREHLKHRRKYMPPLIMS